MSHKQKDKHVMLSYQWKVQKVVSRTYDFLVARHISVWMDIKAGISSDNLFEG